MRTRGRCLSSGLDHWEAGLRDAVAAALELKGIRKRWRGGSEVLRGLDVRVAPGEVVGLVGDNGTGKSTAMGIAAGLVLPDSGTAHVEGRPVSDPQSRRSVGVVPEGNQLPGIARVERYLARMASLSGGGEVDEVIVLCGLTEVRSSRLDQLSKGTRRRVLWAQALVHSPRLLLLDEPFTALDVESRQTLIAEVRRRVAEGAAVLATSHRSEDLDALGARLVNLVDGRAQ